VISPGPCAYNVPSSINSTGKYSNSRFMNSLVKSFNPSSNKTNASKFTFTVKDF